MSFQFEQSSSRQWSSLQAEHDLLENAIKQRQCSGWVEYLDARVADVEREIVMYYVQGFGMGDGRRFALVFEHQIVCFNVMKARDGSGYRSTSLRIESIEIPEELNDRREAVKAVLVEALIVYDQNHAFSFVHTQLMFDYQGTEWTVIPRKYSWLYWKTELAARWPKHKVPLRRAVGYATSPLAIATLFALLMYLSLAGKQVLAWSLVVVGAWLVHRIDRYDSDYRLLYWLIGVAKSKSQFPMLVLSQITARLMTPVPLNLLTVRLHRKHDYAENCIFEITNKSWFFVPYLSVGALEVADAVAPGFSVSLRAQNNGAIDAKKLEPVFPRLSRRWLFPMQSVQWEIRLLQDFPLQAPPSHITAIVSISKRASGERKHGPTSFLLPLTVA